MRTQGCHLIEDLVQIVLNFFFEADLLFEQVEVIHASVHGPILDLLSSWISLLEIADDDLMDL